VVVITIDRYWKIVHSVHQRKHYRHWMLYFELFLPWLNGAATHGSFNCIRRVAPMCTPCNT